MNGTPRISWPKFYDEIVKPWKPGEHAVLIGPTGRGKSTLALQLVKDRPYVVALDAKGGDETLQAIGWEVSYQWPVVNEQERLEKGYPIRVLLRPSQWGRARLREAHDLFSRCLQDCLESTNWTVYIDELRLTSEGRTIDLGPDIEVAYMVGRGRKVSMISSTQAPRWVPKAAYDQASHQFHWPIIDDEARKRQAEISGLGRIGFADATEGMKMHDVLYVYPPDYTAITKPPRLVLPKTQKGITDNAIRNARPIRQRPRPNRYWK